MNPYFNIFSERSEQKLTLEPSQILYEEGTNADRFFGINSGSLIIYKNNQHSRYLFPRFVKSGQILPLNVLKTMVYQDTACCLSYVEVFLINSGLLQQMMDEHVQLRLLVMQEMCKEISKVETLDLNHYNKSLKQKTAHLLLELNNTYGAEKPIPDHCYKLLPYLLDASEKAWKKVMDELARDGVITNEGSQTFVTNRDKIKKIV